MTFSNVGGGWIKKEEGKSPRISVKLENGMYMTIFKNERKEEGSNQPDYNLTMNEDDAKKLGLYKEKKQKDNNEINPEDIPF